MRRYLVLIFYALVIGLGLCCAAIAHGQTVSPLIAECGHKCGGEFSITNNSVQPFSVTLQPFSFSLDSKTGRSIYRPLDSTVDLRLDEMSARVGPKATHTFGYRMKCTAAPCLVTIIATMAVGRTPQGIEVRVALPHTVYQCERQKNCRADVRKIAGMKD